MGSDAGSAGSPDEPSDATSDGWGVDAPSFPRWARWSATAVGAFLLLILLWVVVNALAGVGVPSVSTRTLVGLVVGIPLVVAAFVGALLSSDEPTPLPDAWETAYEAEGRPKVGVFEFARRSSRDELRLGAVAALALAAQMVLFVAAVMPLADSPYDPGAARTYAALGLGGTLLAGAVMGYLLRRGSVHWGLSLFLFVLGWGLGTWAASQIPDLVGDVFIGPDVDAPFVYIVFGVPAVLVVSLVAFVGAAWSRSRDGDRWRDWAAAPLFLWTGFHAQLLLYVWSEAPRLAADARGSGEGGLFLVLVEGLKLLPWLPV